jgi:hypothetical protein
MTAFTIPIETHLSPREVRGPADFRMRASRQVEYNGFSRAVWGVLHASAMSILSPESRTIVSQDNMQLSALNAQPGSKRLY